MSTPVLRTGDVFGLLHPFVDAHTLGLSAVAQLLEDCGYPAIVAGEDVCRAAGEPRDPRSLATLRRWIAQSSISHLGFSYRLDPVDGATAFSLLVNLLRDNKLLSETGGPVRGLFFAGLPEACRRVKQAYGSRVRVFRGDESVLETLESLGVPRERVPRELEEEADYDQARLAFGWEVLKKELPDRVLPPDRKGYPEFGTRRDSLVKRLDHGERAMLPPLMRAHVGLYGSDRERAVREYLDWCARLARSGFLDVLSVGTSQLTQARFGEEWRETPNGGGVPINSPEEFRAVYDASRPMLVRTYAGTSRVPELAHMYEETLNIAWHALSLWWFSQIDGRGPNSVRENLRQHIETLRFVALSGKPFEPNIPHHFAFRGADDASYVASAIVAARLAKRLGVRAFVLQNMMNTPRATWGIQDLAKARVMLRLARELEDRSFRVIYQPRAGLDYFSPDADKAKAQLAAITALMDDVEPLDERSPEVIHVVSYSEGFALADPDVVDESIRITRAALGAYRLARRRGVAPDPDRMPEVADRTQKLEEEVRELLQIMERAIPDLYTPEGLYLAFWAGFFPLPYLWERREEFRHATSWKTRPLRGSVTVVDDKRRPIPIRERAQVAAFRVQQFSAPPRTVRR